MRNSARSLLFLQLCLATFLLTACANELSGKSVDQKTIFSDLSDAGASPEWLTYGHDYTNMRFSPVEEIDTSNVIHLAPAYVFQTGLAESFEGSPIVSDGVMYLSAAEDRVYAIDARSGSLLWQYFPRLGRSLKCCGPVSRGVAVGNGLIIVGQLDDRLVALDQYTGHVVWSARVTDDPRYSITMAPLVYKDTVMIGVAGGEFGIRGFLAAYSLDDGHLRWRWYSTDPKHWPGAFSARTPDGALLPRNLSQERSTYSQFSAAWKRGGGGIWMTPAADPARDVIYLTTGNPWPDYIDSVRPGDNLFTDSIVALDASTGHMKWYYQEVPHDLWDWDAASPVVLFSTFDNTGRKQDLVGEAGKTGWFYVLDRSSGKLAYRSANFVPQSNMFLPPSTATTILPGPGGGSNWSPVSVNPRLGVAVVTAIDAPSLFIDHDAEGAERPLFRRNRALPSYGIATGMDIKTGRILWQDRFDRPLLGGSTSTAGGLTFFGESSGYFDAVETQTGKLLWQFQTGAGVNAPPVVFSIDGVEYVAVASGGNLRIGSREGDSLFVFGLSK